MQALRSFAAAGFLLLGTLVTASPAVAGDGPVPQPPPGVTITVGGVEMVGEEGGKIPGCSIDLGIAGMDASEEAPLPIGIVLKAVPPMTPEGQPDTLVSDADQAVGPDWSRSYDLTTLLAPYDPHANGYRVRVEVRLDGVLAAASAYWLGCGQAQTGNPTRILFAVEWLTNDGILLDEAPDGRLPDGWRSSFVLTGTSKKGVATCTFPAGSGVLVCEYDNPGHGDDPGLVVPGNPKATYAVAVTGVPARWDPDPADLGTFVGRDVCPRGHGGDDGGHGDEVVASVEDEGGHEGEGPFVCTHTVRLIEQPPPPTTTTTTTVPPPEPTVTEPPTTVAPTTVAEVEGEQQVQATLPVTGPAHLWLVPVGLALLGLGALTLRQSRRLAALER